MANYSTKFKLTLAITALTLFWAANTLLAQTGGEYDLSWFTVDGGGEASNQNGYTLTGTVGQPDVGVMSGGAYTLAGGFWGPTGSENIYLPLILKNR